MPLCNLLFVPQAPTYFERAGSVSPTSCRLLLTCGIFTLVHAQLEGDDSGSESGDVGTPLPVQKAPSSLPRLSPRDLSPLEQKRALRLEMLTRMKEEFHAKHGRRHRGGLENIRNKVGIRVPGAHTSATVVDPDGQSHGPVREGSSATAGTAPKTDKSRRSNVTSTSITERNNTNDDNDTRGNRSSRSKTDKSDTSLPVTAPSTPHDPRRHSISNTEGTSTNSPRRSTPTYYSGQEHPAALTRDVSGSSMDGAGRGSMAATVSNQGAPVHLCVCCGGEGGKGHGRLCEHMFRRCGFCRVEEVKRVLGIRGLDGRVRRDRRVSVSGGVGYVGIGLCRFLPGVCGCFISRTWHPGAVRHPKDRTRSASRVSIASALGRVSVTRSFSERGKGGSSKTTTIRKGKIRGKQVCSQKERSVLEKSMKMFPRLLKESHGVTDTIPPSYHTATHF